MTAHQTKGTEPPMPTLVWRTPRYVRALAVGVAMLFTGLLWDSYKSPESSDPAWGLLLLLSISYLFCWVAAFRPRASVDEHYLDVTNFVRRHQIPLGDIDKVSPAFEGLRVGTHGGKKITVVAVQRTNISLFLHRENRSDGVATEILRRASCGD